MVKTRKIKDQLTEEGRNNYTKRKKKSLNNSNFNGASSSSEMHSKHGKSHTHKKGWTCYGLNKSDELILKLKTILV
jgi:hypothetical protein